MSPSSSSQIQFNDFPLRGRNEKPAVLFKWLAVTLVSFLNRSNLPSAIESKVTLISKYLNVIHTLFTQLSKYPM